MRWEKRREMKWNDDDDDDEMKETNNTEHTMLIRYDGGKYTHKPNLKLKTKGTSNAKLSIAKKEH